MQPLRILIAAPALAALVTFPALVSLAATPPAGQPTAAPTAAPFEAPAVRALLPGETAPRPYDLGAAIRRRPVVICYFLPGESLGEETLLRLQDEAARLEGKVLVIGATRLTGKLSPAGVAERLGLLGVTLPVIVEEDLALAAALKVTTAPSINLLDRAGIVRVSDARSLKQPIAEGMTVADAIHRMARGDAIPTAGKLPRYYPASELVGTRLPEFLLKPFPGTGAAERVRVSDYIGREGTGVEGKKHRRILALFFWHPDCKHCKQAMPGVVTGWNTYKEYIDLVGITDLKNADEARNAEDTIRAHRMTFPILLDEDHRVKDLCRVISTPTMFFVRPDGTVESVYTRGDVNYLPVFSAKIRSILGIASRLQGRPSGSN